MNTNNSEIKYYTSTEWPKAARLLKLFYEEGSSRRSHEPEYYRWKMEENPLTEGIFNLADCSNEVVGVTTVTPKRISLFGQETRGAEIGDTFTHPGYQRRGIFSKLVNMTREGALSKRLSFIYGTPNDNSLPGYEKKLNFGRIPYIGVECLVLPLNFKRVLNNMVPKLSVITPVLARLLKGGFKLLFKSHKMSANNVELVKEYPSSITSFCTAALEGHDCYLVRDYQYLKWRYCDNPDRYNIYLVRDREDVSGYLVVKTGKWNGLNVVYFADFLCAQSGRDAFRDLICRALTDVGSEDIDMVVAWSCKNSIYHGAMKRFGFQKFKDIPVICFKNDLGNRVINSKLKWHFTMGDSDNI